MGVWHSIGRLFLGDEEDEMKVLEGIRERKREVRYATADRLEEDGRLNIKNAIPGPLGNELREQGEKMVRQAGALRSGEISLLAALNLDDDEDTLREVVENTVEGEAEGNGYGER